jgi:acyl carrier protein
MVMDKIKAMLAEKLDIDAETITAETKFADLGIDSLDITEMLMDIEDEFNIEVEMDTSLATVGALVDKIESLVG